MGQLCTVVVVARAHCALQIHGRKIFHTWEQSEKMIVEHKLGAHVPATDGEHGRAGIAHARPSAVADLSPAVSHRVPLTQFEEAFQALFSGDAVKIVMDPQH